MELGSLVCQYLVWFTVLVDAILKEMDSLLACRIAMDLAAWNVSAVVIQVTDHPFIAIGHLEV
jgi:hypothetical protein